MSILSPGTRCLPRRLHTTQNGSCPVSDLTFSRCRSSLLPAETRSVPAAGAARRESGVRPSPCWRAAAHQTQLGAQLCTQSTAPRSWQEPGRTPWSQTRPEPPGPSGRGGTAHRALPQRSCHSANATSVLKQPKRFLCYTLKGMLQFYTTN